MLTTLFIEILNLKTFFLKPTKNSTKLRLLISEPHSLLRKEKSLMKNSELHTTLLLKSLTRIMAPNVTFGQSVLLLISSFQVSHHLTARQIKKLWRKLNWVNSTSMIHHGNKSLILAKTLLLNFLHLTKTHDQVLNKLLSIHSFNLLLLLLKMLSIRMSLHTQWPTWNLSMLNPSCNKPLTPSSHPNFCQNKKKSKLTKFSELWMQTATVNFPKRKSRMVTSSTCTNKSLMMKSTRCLPKLILITPVKLIILSSLLLLWAKSN